MTDDVGRRPPFDPRPYLRDGVLEVRARLLWLRSEHPDARIVTEHVTLDEQQAIFRAAIDVPGGGHATGYGSATRAEGHDYIERAEEKAVGRALATLGYGIQYAADFDAAQTVEPAPVEAARETPRAAEPVPVRRPEPAAVAPAAAPVERLDEARVHRASAAQSARGEVREPRVRVVPRESDMESEAPAPQPPAAVPDSAEPEFEPADYNWTEFWRWARPLGYTRRSDLDKLLGVDTNALTPREVRQRLMEHRRLHGEDD